MDVDSDSIPEFNEPVGLQAEAQNGGVMMLPNFNGDPAAPHRSGENGERGDEYSEEYVEFRRRRSGAQDVVTYGILSSLLAVHSLKFLTWKAEAGGYHYQVVSLM